MSDIRPFRNHKPVIAASAYVDSAAVIIGEVLIGEEVSIWPGVVLRGDHGRIEIGSQSNIQDGTIAHATGGFSYVSIGERVTVGHRVLLHGCIVDSDCLIVTDPLQNCTKPDLDFAIRHQSPPRIPARLSHLLSAP